jgi:hypothetical protein
LLLFARTVVPVATAAAKAPSHRFFANDPLSLLLLLPVLLLLLLLLLVLAEAEERHRAEPDDVLQCLERRTTEDARITIDIVIVPFVCYSLLFVLLNE